MILVIDNYDSFVYNLARYILELGCEAHVIRNDQLTLADISAAGYTHVVLSPGPCTPNEAGICLDVVKHFTGKLPILGVCLGHQAIAQAFGGRIVSAMQPMHGMASVIHRAASSRLMGDLPESIIVGRYHSLVVSPDGFPSELAITATSEVGEIMALEHRVHPVFGVQFHPESVLSEQGYAIIDRFLRFVDPLGQRQKNVAAHH